MIYYTHSGRFHCDEVLGFAIARLAGKCTDFERITNIDDLPNNGLIANIGRVYNPKELLFDHHQGFFQRKNNGIPMATAGMLWQMFGHQAIANTIADEIFDAKWLVEKVDKSLIQGVDAHDADNRFEVAASCSAGKIKVLTLPEIVRNLNLEDVHSHHGQRDQFLKAVEICSDMLISNIRYAKSLLQVYQTHKEYTEFNETKGYLVFHKSINWFELVHDNYPWVNYIIKPSDHPGSNFSLISVPIDPYSIVLKRDIDRPDWFTKFIHQGKWIAGSDSIEELEKLISYNNSISK